MSICNDTDGAIGSVFKFEKVTQQPSSISPVTRTEKRKFSIANCKLRMVLSESFLLCGKQRLIYRLAASSSRDIPTQMILT